MYIYIMYIFCINNTTIFFSSVMHENLLIVNIKHSTMLSLLTKRIVGIQKAIMIIQLDVKFTFAYLHTLLCIQKNLYIIIYSII